MQHVQDPHGVEIFEFGLIKGDSSKLDHCTNLDLGDASCSQYLDTDDINRQFTENDNNSINGQVFNNDNYHSDSEFENDPNEIENTDEHCDGLMLIEM